MSKYWRKKCVVCGERFYGHEARKYCSDECREKSRQDRMDFLECVICGRQFYGVTGFNGSPAQKYCSKECKNARIKARVKSNRPTSKYDAGVKDEVFKRLTYNAELGELRWRDDDISRYRGKLAGYIKSQGPDPEGPAYKVVGICGRLYSAASIIWLLMTGEWPPEGYVVDHKNRNGLDNRWSNLRLLTPSQNSRNRDALYKSFCPLPTGVQFMNDKPRKRPYNARIRKVVNGKSLSESLGYFETAEEASAAYEAALLREGDG